MNEPNVPVRDVVVIRRAAPGQSLLFFAAGLLIGVAFLLGWVFAQQSVSNTAAVVPVDGMAGNQAAAGASVEPAGSVDECSKNSKNKKSSNKDNSGNTVGVTGTNHSGAKFEQGKGSTGAFDGLAVSTDGGSTVGIDGGQAVGDNGNGNGIQGNGSSVNIIANDGSTVNVGSGDQAVSESTAVSDDSNSGPNDVSPTQQTQQDPSSDSTTTTAPAVPVTSEPAAAPVAGVANGS
ncbi:hypothetical protein N9D66_00775 [Candidatus Nanopelagicales bacterium]|nr:hypothetical protein [Candidatus Nanopelagicales bacterium]